jgi:hypothetical protein
MRAFRLIAVLAVASLPAAALRAQDVAYARPTGANVAHVDTARALDQMRHDLRELVDREQEFFSNYASYTSELDFAGFEPSTGVTVEVLWHRDDAWAARARHDALPGSSCVIWAGPVAARDSLPATDRERKTLPQGSAACDGDGIPKEDAEVALAAWAMRATLWRLVTAEGTYGIQHGQYTTDVSQLEGFRASEGVTLTMIWADKESWAATTAHPLLPGKSCLVWGGKRAKGAAPRTAGSKRPGGESEVVCDDR